jgi:hypothetical protein
MPQRRARAKAPLLYQLLLQTAMLGQHLSDGCTGCYKGNNRLAATKTSICLAADVALTPLLSCCWQPFPASRLPPPPARYPAAPRCCQPPAQGPLAVAGLRRCLSARGPRSSAGNTLERRKVKCITEQVSAWTAGAKQASVVRNIMPPQML